MAATIRTFGVLVLGVLWGARCGMAQNPTSNVTLNGPDDATVAAGTYSSPATYWNGAITAVNFGNFLLEDGWAVGLDFQSQWTGGTSNNGLTAANGQDAGNAGFLTATNNGNISLFGAGTPDPVYGVRFAMLGGIGGLGTGNNDAGSGGSANAGVSAVNAGSVQVWDSLVNGGSAFYAGAVGGRGGDTEGTGKVGAGGDAVGAGYHAVSLTNSGVVTAGSAVSVASGSAGYSAITALAQGGAAGVRTTGSPQNGHPNGTGGNAGTVSLIHSGTAGIWWQATGTAGGEVFGIVAASEGGAGSDSGNNGTSAGAGGSAGAVAVTISSGAEVEAAVDNTAQSGGAANLHGAAVAAISLGGGGGSTVGSGTGGAGGGAAVGGTTTLSLTEAVVEASGHGISGLVVANQGGAGGNGTAQHSHSNGGAGGGAGAVQATLAGGSGLASVTTSGSGAAAVSVSTEAGAGGFGGPNTLDFSDTSGNGGAGGSAGSAVFVTSGSVSLITTGADSTGVSVVSRGGSGGEGGEREGVDNGSGSGGAAGNAGAVSFSVGTGGAITTSGSASTGLAAASFGGKGGAGGFVSTLDGTPGSGGNGGSSGLVSGTIAAGATVTTAGNSSAALLLQSFSGGGGQGAGIDNPGPGDAGAGGIGGNAGIVNGSGVFEAIAVTNAGTLTTAGENSIGILAQAISGAAGASGQAGGSFNDQASYSSQDGFVGSIAIIHSGTITTGPSPAPTPGATLDGPGAASHGILAQGVSGGGGAAGGGGSILTGLGGNKDTNPNVANGGNVNVSSAGEISTGGPIAHGILAQSVGGGGGDGGTSQALAVAVGGSGGAGGAGGTVSVYQSGGAITTGGALSHGIVAHSIGGGGGNAGAATAVGLGSTLDPIEVAIGGRGGNGGDGGVVTVGLEDTSLTAQTSNSVGVLAQSIGGGGGAGGSAGAFQAGFVFSAATAVGGKGGLGGNGGAVLLTAANSTITTGLSPAMTTTDPVFADNTNQFPVDAFGLAVHSIGGGGGKGGNSVADAFSFATLTSAEDGPETFSASLTFSVGGQGGTAGDGGSAEIEVMDGTVVSTLGQGSHGVVVQTVGGGGGLGGDSSAAATSLGFGRATQVASGSSLSVDITLIVSGSGGGGGNGGATQAWLGGTALGAFGEASSVTTRGDFASAVLAQSIGGGGGNAGTGTGNASSYGSTQDLTVTVTLGAMGGVGGDGGAVDSTLYDGSTLTTYGDGAAGLVGQSIGGGGGTSFGGGYTIGGGYAITAVGSGTWGESAYVMPNLTYTTNLGATGAAGGNGGTVQIVVDGVISTAGNDSAGVFAQSIGGGGGMGGSAASEASADNPIREEGTARNFATNLVTVTAQTNASVTHNLANTGGGGGDGGLVTVALNNDVTTLGDWSQGVVAQSVGGGGGKAASALQQQIRLPLDISFNAAADTTGIPANSNGGTSQVNLGGSVLSTGQNVPGESAGYGAYGVLVQSVGGGGGLIIDGSQQAQGTIQLGQNTGGGGGGSGNGGLAELTTTGSNSVTTRGEAAHGIVLQSVGGSGGLAGAGATQIASQPPPPGSLPIGTTPLVPPPSAGVDISLGGGENSRGNGGNVSLNDQGTLAITTSGLGASGIIAQSVGGGGGIAMVQQIGGVAVGGNGFPIDAGEGNASYGGNVTLQFGGQSTLSTSGIGAHGIVAQSVGGGGGIANYVTSGNAGLQTGVLPLSGLYANGYGGNVNVVTLGEITTTGDMAFGVLAQSVGAGGGIAFDGANLLIGTTGFSAPSEFTNPSVGGGGFVTVQQSGLLSATGTNSVAIFAQSTGQGSSGASPINDAISVTVSGNVSGGAGPRGYGVWVDGGNSANILTISEGASLSAVSGQAVYTSNGAMLTVSNFGDVTGNVTATTLNNETTGTFATGLSVAGSVVDGGVTFIAEALPGTIGDLAVSGTYHQLSTGTLEFDVETLSLFDRLEVTGESTFEGHLNLWFLEVGYSPAVADTFSLITAQAGSTFDFASIVLQNLGPGYTFTEFTTTDGLVTTFGIQITAVPEPAGFGLVLASLAALGLLRRRRADGSGNKPGR